MFHSIDTMSRKNVVIIKGFFYFQIKRHDCSDPEHLHHLKLNIKRQVQSETTKDCLTEIFLYLLIPDDTK